MYCLFGVFEDGVTTDQLSPAVEFIAPIECAIIALCILGGEAIPPEKPEFICREISPIIGTDGDGEW